MVMIVESTAAAAALFSSALGYDFEIVTKLFGRSKHFII
jgi:hypothetical protein